MLPDARIEPPRYPHDCDGCVYLGPYFRDDLYVCPDAPTVVARHSSEPSDYGSGLSFVGRVPSLTEAHRRAVERGLLDPKSSTWE